MERRIHVTCHKGLGSLRQAIVDDEDGLRACGLEVVREKKGRRKPGWATLGARDGIRGRVKIQWLAPSDLLVCRVASRGESDPAPITRAFERYLKLRWSARILEVHHVPDAIELGVEESTD